MTFFLNNVILTSGIQSNQIIAIVHIQMDFISLLLWVTHYMLPYPLFKDTTMINWIKYTCKNSERIVNHLSIHTIINSEGYIKRMERQLCRNKGITRLSEHYTSILTLYVASHEYNTVSRIIF